MLKEGHIAIAFAAGVSNQAPVSAKWMMKGKVELNYIVEWHLLRPGGGQTFWQV